MKETTKAMRGQMKNIKIDDVEKVHDDMEDLLLDQEEIQEVLGRSYAGMDEIDEDELDDELAALDSELLGEDDELDLAPSYLQDTVPEPATAEPVAAGGGGGGEQLDEFGLPAAPVCASDDFID